MKVLSIVLDIYDKGKDIYYIVLLLGYPFVLFNLPWFPKVRLVSIWIFISLQTVINSLNYAIKKAIKEDKTAGECVKEALLYFFRITDVDVSANTDEEYDPYAKYGKETLEVK